MLRTRTDHMNPPWRPHTLSMTHFTHRKGQDVIAIIIICRTLYQLTECPIATLSFDPCKFGYLESVDGLDFIFQSVELDHVGRRSESIAKTIMLLLLLCIRWCWCRHIGRRRRRGLSCRLCLLGGWLTRCCRTVFGMVRFIRIQRNDRGIEYK